MVSNRRSNSHLRRDLWHYLVRNLKFRRLIREPLRASPKKTRRSSKELCAVFAPIYPRLVHNFKRGELSARVPTETEDILSRYGREVGDIGAAETDANRQAGVAFREQSFRNIPEIQRSIRESLGGAGTIGNAAALSALSRPVLEANRASRDFEAGLEQQRLGNITARQEKVADTGLNARSQAMQTRLGLDKDTIDYLTSIGREDLVREAEGLLGIEDQLGTNRLGIEQANARRTGILSSLGSIAGTGVGFLAGGPVGAGLGSQLGGTVGNLAGGGTGGGTFDPTLLFALAQRNRSNVSRSLSGGRSTPIGTGYSTQVGY